MIVGLIALMGEWGVRNGEIQGWPKIKNGGQMVNVWYLFLPPKNVAYF